MGVRISVQSFWPQANASTFVYEFAQSRIIIGRSRSADVQLPHEAVSGTHASIRAEGVGYAVFDEGSTNGTRVNDVLLVPGRPKTLRPNDRVDLGGYRLTVEVGVPVAQTMSARLAADFARQMLEEQLGSEEATELDARLEAIRRGVDQRVDLLPIAKALSEPAAQPKLARSELAVYALAVVVVATSVIVMALLMQS
jgi:pSer/pThr/pTyr-binding forkhead associated (FHA) protein